MNLEISELGNDAILSAQNADKMLRTVLRLICKFAHRFVTICRDKSSLVFARLEWLTSGKHFHEMYTPLNQHNLGMQGYTDFSYL